MIPPPRDGVLLGLLVIMLVGALMLFTGWLMGAFEPRENPYKGLFEGAVVVRVCRDGTRIYRLTDHRIVIGGWAEIPDPNRDIEEICP